VSGAPSGPGDSRRAPCAAVATGWTFALSLLALGLATVARGQAAKPANAKEFVADTRIGGGESYVPGIFEGAWKSQPAGKKLSGFMFTVGPKGLLTDGLLVGGQNNTFSIGNDQYVLDLKSRSPRRENSGSARRFHQGTPYDA
jgi:hypothetical protein